MDKQTLKLPPEVTESNLKSGGNRFHNQVQWARQYLVWQGLIDDSKRGTWTLTPLGWKTDLDAESSRKIFLERVKDFQEQRAESAGEIPSIPIPGSDELLPDEQQEQTLLDVLKSLPPYGFELICERLLRENGFEDVEVTKQSRDGGIDGFGVLRLSPFRQREGRTFKRSATRTWFPELPSANSETPFSGAPKKVSSSRRGDFPTTQRSKQRVKVLYPSNLSMASGL